MKVFIPMTDKMLSEQAEMTGVLVPFTPELIVDGESKQAKPVNWIPESNYQQACKRLHEQVN